MEFFWIKAAKVGLMNCGCWEDVPFQQSQILKQGIQAQLRHAGPAEMTVRPRVYVVEGPEYPIALFSKPFSAGYPGRGQTFAFSWQRQGIVGIPRVAGHADRYVGVAGRFSKDVNFRH